MDISYNKLFKIMIDRKMKKKDLQILAGLSPASIAKLSKDQYVSMEVLVKICRALKVDIGDIVEVNLLWHAIDYCISEKNEDMPYAD